MSIFLKATRQKLRIQTPRGPLSVEQLWDLNVTELDDLAVKLQEDYKNSKGKSFVTKRTRKDRTVKLMFDVVLQILQTKLEDQERTSERMEIKTHNQKIMTLIQRKKDQQLTEMDIEELESMLK